MATYGIKKPEQEFMQDLVGKITSVPGNILKMGRENLKQKEEALRSDVGDWEGQGLSPDAIQKKAQEEHRGFLSLQKPDYQITGSKPAFNIATGAPDVPAPLAGLGMDALTTANKPPSLLAEPGQAPAVVPSPAAEIPAAAPTPAAGVTAPWSQTKVNEELGLGEARGIKGPKGEITLTNRATPFTGYKELPDEAYGIGGKQAAQAKSSLISKLEKEMQSQFPAAGTRKLLAELTGAKGITPYEQKTLENAKKAAETQESQFKSTHELAMEKQMMEEFSKVAGTQSVKGQDALGNEITTTKVDPEMYQQAMVFGEGKITPSAIKQTVQWKKQRTAVSQGLPLLIANKGNQQMQDAIIKQMLDQGVPQTDIDSMLEQVKTAK